jgi:plastocyanin
VKFPRKLCVPTIVLILVTCNLSISAQDVTASGHIKLIGNRSKSSGFVVWLSPMNGAIPSITGDKGRGRLRLIQRDKQFDPHLMVVPVGSAVEFPNLDPWFHNVFSLFEGKRFDLGLYEAGSSRTIRFDRAGISYVFCNIHPEMSAIVVAVPTPYYAISDRRGDVNIPNIPPGRYVLHLWQEDIPAKDTDALKRVVELSETSSSFGTIEIQQPASSHLPHKDKYGQDYAPPEPTSPVYAR